jgi:hypothetical protein
MSRWGIPTRPQKKYIEQSTLGQGCQLTLATASGALSPGIQMSFGRN